MAIGAETMETVTEFIFLGSNITADGDCSHEIKRRLLLGRKVMTNLDSILKSRGNTLPTKVYLVKAMVFPVVLRGRDGGGELMHITSCLVWSTAVVKCLFSALRKSLQLATLPYYGH